MDGWIDRQIIQRDPGTLVLSSSSNSSTVCCAVNRFGLGVRTNPGTSGSRAKAPMEDV